MKKKKWIMGILAGLISGLLVSSIMTYQDWCFNPNGIFHSDANGTNWSFVWDTWISWFIPVTWPVTVVVLIVLFVVEKLKKH